MQEKLILIVEDDRMISKLISMLLEANGANFIIAHNFDDAVSLFRANKDNITHVLLDGSLTKIDGITSLPQDPETLPLAEEIARTEGFCGSVYPMSTVPDYIDKLMSALGIKGVFLGEGLTKPDIILHIIRLIKEKR
jgi:hypothetical protein